MNNPVDPAAFIRENLRLTPVPTVPEIAIYTAHPGSGLRRMLEAEGEDMASAPPYWAYPWAGGLALANYLRDHPETVANRHILDLGAGSGLVGIMAAMLGAAKVTAAEIDRNARIAIDLNASANAAAIELADDPLSGDPPPADIILAGDFFYAADLAARALAFLDRCRSAGVDILIGDPGRNDLPEDRLEKIAEYSVPDFGSPRAGQLKKSGVYRLRRQPPAQPR